MRRWLLVALAVLGAACSSPDKERPNIVFVLVDDMNERLLPYLPRLHQLMPAQGMSFEMRVPTPVCAPSRSSMLTGKYAHNTTVKTNGVWAGGIWALRAGHNEEKTFAVWLQKAGYQTGMFGKYVNGHDGKEADVPQGWDRWVSYSKVTLQRTGIEVIENGGARRPVEKQYDTDFFAQQAREWIGVAKEPFLAMWTPMAPHGPFVSPARHRHRFDEIQFKWPPSFSADVDAVEKLTRTRLEMMLGVEDGLVGIIEALRKRGILERTYIVFTSDHGLFMGEHGFPAGKGEPYEETTRVPLFVRGPGVPVGWNDDLIASIDLAPTFAEIAGAKVPEDVDGRSILPLWHAKDLERPRKRFLLEWFDPVGKVLWQGLRTANRKYVRYADGTCKNFALDSDPYEMTSLPCDDDFAKESAGYIDRLGSCSGASCSAADTE
jgi:N-acetylglucosamine-6-sulfatase